MRIKANGLMSGATLGAVLVSVLTWVSPASALWSNASAKTSGSLNMAQMGKTFTPIKVGALIGVASGAGGSSYVSQFAGLGTVFYFDLANDSSVQAGLSGTLTATLNTGLVVVPAITVWRCASAWNTTLGTCATGATVVTGPHSWNSVPSFEWGTIASGSTHHIAVTTGIAAANIKLTASATPWPTRSGIDRSAG